ncbi:RcnB family protein [Sphingomonas naphthae]|uniref:RcnB family protein n=1 Tax=Sphingomonas naphthae TaxID=1813468 RepID=A0ABY7TKD2_9SPHN|nr:RcnB family protein [Sphingomonas naphthae]WCT72339.1 RcnB family protein [Sphingomonas naphthae]
MRIATTALLLAAAATPAIAAAQEPDRSYGRPGREAPNPGQQRATFRDNGGQRSDAADARREFRQTQRPETIGERGPRPDVRADTPPAQVRQDRQELRGDRRDIRDDRRDIRNDRRDIRDDRRDDRRDWRDDRRDDRRYDNRGWDNRGGWNGNDRGAQWNNRWRDDRRYDWQGYRTANRNIYRLPRYYAPRGYAYRRWSVGYRFDPWAYDRSYWINDPYQYRLPPAYGSYRWVRYYDDVALVDISTGLIADVLYSFFLR